MVRVSVVSALAASSALSPLPSTLESATGLAQATELPESSFDIIAPSLVDNDYGPSEEGERDDELQGRGTCKRKTWKHTVFETATMFVTPSVIAGATSTSYVPFATKHPSLFPREEAEAAREGTRPMMIEGSVDEGESVADYATYTDPGENVVTEAEEAEDEEEEPEVDANSHTEDAGSLLYKRAKCTTYVTATVTKTPTATVVETPVETFQTSILPGETTYDGQRLAPMTTMRSDATRALQPWWM